MRTSFHHQPEAQHPIFQLSTSWQADYPIFRAKRTSASDWRTIANYEYAAFCMGLVMPSLTE